ncbi:MAG: nitrilase [Firmicutes bacterium]|nr:nitrilase [Bacillota bacterium]
MKTALIQMNIKLGDVATNQAKADTLMTAGLKEGAKLFVLPELWTTGYKLENIFEFAEPENGPTITMLRHFAISHQVEIIAGSLAEKAGDKIYNTAYTIDRRGEIVAKYRKIHLFGLGLMNEKDYLSSGNTQEIFDLSTGKAGLIICYDLRFTELPRALALKGCRTLFVPAQWPAARGQHWLTLTLARAIENQMFVIAVNRVGSDSNTTFFGNSLAVSPWGEILAQGSASEEQTIIVDIDFSLVDDVRQRIPIFTDRRPECY